ncbi:MAG: carbohydrate-binding domain-containing protein [Ruminococcaceae bacterium]|nr:carbohydrate-binding domain-containing protein [Oscillospiraceae bacterium]
MTVIKRITAFCLSAVLVLCLFTGCSEIADASTDDGKIHYRNETDILLSDDKITANGRTVYKTISNIYISNDVVYYEDRDYYDSGRPYGLGLDSDKHSAEEAAAVTVLNITQAGTYRLSGKLSNGQIRIDLSKRARSNANAVVTLVFDGLDINCDIAPAIVFRNVYECELNTSSKTASSNVDTSGAGANIIIADGSINSISGSHVAKIYKDNDDEKKRWKQDGTIYSYMSLNINGEAENSGILNVTADFEGISAEKHISVNGGNICIIAQNDGINVNDDYSSVTINGGNLRIMAGLSEDGGDGIDSNGWIVVNGGTTVSIGHRSTDSGVDDEKGYYANGGTLISFGSHIDWADYESRETSFNLEFAEEISSCDAVIITDKDGNAVFCYEGYRDDILSRYPCQRQGVNITSPVFNIGESYNLYIGRSTEDFACVTGSETNGIYDVSTITETDAVQQVYYSNDDIFHGGFRAQDGKNYDIPYSDFVMSKTVSSFALIEDIAG